MPRERQTARNMVILAQTEMEPQRGPSKDMVGSGAADARAALERISTTAPGTE